MGHTISRKSIKKIITILTAAILVLLPVGGSIREVHAEGEESSDSGMSLEHEKTVTENADGTYDLKLTVKGKVNSESSKAPLDVIYVLDRSGSMAYPMDRDSQNSWENNGERRNAASQAIDSMTNTLAANENLDVRFALVTFSGNKSDYRPGGYRDEACDHESDFSEIGRRNQLSGRDQKCGRIAEWEKTECQDSSDLRI